MEKDKRSRARVVFFGSFGRSNFGNEATLQAMLSNLRRLMPETEFICLCTGPEGVAKDYKITAVPIREHVIEPWETVNPLARLARKILVGIPSEFWRWVQGVKVLRGAVALVVPGTGLITDAHTLLNYGPYDMFRWSVVAKLARCKLIFMSVGAGPLYSRAGRFFAKTALWLSDFRSYRDESSKRYLKGIGLRTDNDPVYPDLAFSLPATALPRARESKGRRMLVGLGLMEFGGMYGSGRPTKAAYSAYLKTLVQLVAWLLPQACDVRLLTGDTGDTSAIQDFVALMRERSVTGGEHQIINEPVTSVEDLLRQLAGTDMVVATRFHNVLLSLLLNKPTISISFHDKCSSVMRQMGMAGYILDINDLNFEMLTERFRRLKENAENLKTMLAGKVEEHRDALDEQYKSVLQVMWPAGEQLWAAETHKATSRVVS